jgi:DNA-binding NarL/FixJ family response regulator
VSPKRQSSSPTRRRRHGRKIPARLAEQELLEIVRTGVERFILKDATVEEFLKMIRSLTEKENAYSHQLTRNAFSRIVKQAIKKRNLKRGT